MELWKSVEGEGSGVSGVPLCFYKFFGFSNLSITMPRVENCSILCLWNPLKMNFCIITLQFFNFGFHETYHKKLTVNQAELIEKIQKCAFERKSKSSSIWYPFKSGIWMIWVILSFTVKFQFELEITWMWKLVFPHVL